MANSEWKLGKVRWFDESKGFGFIRAENGNSYYVHYSAIDSKKKFKNLKESSDVKFKLHVDENFVQIAQVREI